MPTQSPNVRTAAAQIVLPYLVLGVVWILASDEVAIALAGDVMSERWIQTVKGLGFIAATAGMLFAMCVRRLRALAEVERELRESERRFGSMMDNLRGMAYQCLPDADWTMVFVSRGAGALTGFGPGELVHNRAVSYQHLVHPADRDRVRREVESAVADRRSFGLEYRIVTRDGSERWVWEQGLAVPGPQGDAVLLEGFISDITDRKALEELEEERRVLRDSRRAVEEALGAIGHELRTPLASQRLLAEALTEPDLDDTERVEMARGILEQTERLAEMATNMLEGARLRGGNAVWRWGQVDVCRAIQSAAAVMAPLAARSGVRVEVRCGGCGTRPPCDLQVLGDADALRRLAINLLSNACRHAPSGEVVLRVDRRGEHVVLEVSDNGQGMSPEVLSKLGRAFALNNGPLSAEPSSGAGLGLAICRQIVAAHWGRISVASHEGRGTTITVTLPTDRPGPREAAAPEPIRMAA